MRSVKRNNNGYYLDPPYIPPEHRNKTHDEMPEPYRSEIDKWIEAERYAQGKMVKVTKAHLIATILLAVAIFSLFSAIISIIIEETGF